MRTYLHTYKDTYIQIKGIRFRWDSWLLDNEWVAPLRIHFKENSPRHTLLLYINMAASWLFPWESRGGPQRLPNYIHRCISVGKDRVQIKTSWPLGGRLHVVPPLEQLPLFCQTCWNWFFVSGCGFPTDLPHNALTEKKPVITIHVTAVQLTWLLSWYTDINLVYIHTSNIYIYIKIFIFRLGILVCIYTRLYIRFS